MAVRTKLHSRLALALPCALACACADEVQEPGPPPESELVAGLELRGADFFISDDHQVEVVVHGEYAYVANSNVALGAAHLDADGGVTTTWRGLTYEDLMRCTTLAVHAPSDTLYCGADDTTSVQKWGYSIHLFDLSDPEIPTLRGSAPLENRTHVRDIELIGERLVVHEFDGGIEVLPVMPDGELGPRTSLELEGNARYSVGVGELVVSLFADDSDTGQGAELRLYAVDEAGTEAEAWTLLDLLPLAGPPIGLSADVSGRERVAVALGSGGMAIVSVDEQQGLLAVERHLQPPAVVTWPLLDDEQVHAVTLSGIFSYALEGEHAGTDGEPRLFGFGPAAQAGPDRAGNMLHGTFYGDELLVSDWLWLERWAVDPAGEVLDLDVPRGIYLQPDGPVRWRMRNSGSQLLRAELWWDRKLRWSAEVEPESELLVELPADLREQLLNASERRAVLGLRVHDPSLPSNAVPVSTSAVVIAERPEDDLIPPALGDPFPELTLASLEREVFSFPLAEGSQTIWFWPDCAMIWPQLEDLAWLERMDMDLGRGVPVMLANVRIDDDGFDRRWALAGARFGMWGAAAPEVGDANDYIDSEDIYMRLWNDTLPGDAMPTDYVMDEQGIVRSIERMYRGPWTLVERWPFE